MRNTRKYGLFAAVAALVFGGAVLAGASGQALLLIGFVFVMVLMHGGHGHGGHGHGGHGQGGHGQHGSGTSDRQEPHDHTRSR